MEHESEADHGRSEFETLAEDDRRMPIGSSIDVHGRSKLESDIVDIATGEGVQTALRQMLSTSNTKENHFTLQMAARRPAYLRAEFKRGVQLMLSISCDKRLEISHWKVSQLHVEEGAGDVVEWFFTEAAYLSIEADDEDAELVERIFGIAAGTI